MRSLLVALAFLTTIPVPFRQSPTADTVARSRWWYPVIGLMLGTILGGWAMILSSWIHSAPLCAFLVLTGWIGLTGALHLDGFCDVCDGLLGGGTPEERLRIMKDPYLGTFGLVGGVVLLLGKFVTLQVIVERAQSPWVIGGAVLVGRCLVLCLAAGSVYPRAAGTGKALVEATRGWESWLFAAAAVLAALMAGSLPCVVNGAAISRNQMLVAGAAFTAAFLAVMGLKWCCRRRLGGTTGDCLGAGIELVEVMFLLTVAILNPTSA